MLRCGLVGDRFNFPAINTVGCFMAKERIDTYPEAARAIALWLDEFCDKSLRYPEMIADAARKAAQEIELLRCEAPNKPVEQTADPCEKCGLPGCPGICEP